MEDIVARLDSAFLIIRSRLNEVSTISVSEPLDSDNPPGMHFPLRVCTVSVADQPIAIFGLTHSSVSPRSPAFLNYIARRARARSIDYTILCNQRETHLVNTPSTKNESYETHRHYSNVAAVTAGNSADIAPLERIALGQLADQVARDLIELHDFGRLDLVIPDSDFFVDRLTKAVDILKPAVKQALQTKLQMDPHFGKSVEKWAILQGIPADLRSPDFAEAVVRQAIYRLLGKIIFYQSLRRARPALPEMDLQGLDTGQVIARLKFCFQKAHEIDYHAVFREDVVDDLPFPAAASSELINLVTDLNTRDFAHLPQDVVGAVFERLIPPEDRHALGQYFTPESLVDLIIAFCLRNPDDKVLDPTCGTGTFLLRAYDHLRTYLGVHDHPQLLGQLWGIDIAPFPAELATINLFRLSVDDPSNFPRIVNEDFFDIEPEGTYRFPPLKPDQNATSEIDEPIPAFDVIVGNFPYISADRIDRRVKGYREKINRCVCRDWFLDYADGFTFKSKKDQKQHNLARKNNLDLEPFQNIAQPSISTYADLYVYLFWHSAVFLKPGGRMGIVTSNAWLDVSYGYALQRFLLDHFKIIAILESRCQPWFEQVSVNTVVTILERCDDAKDRYNHPVRFIKIKRVLEELIPEDLHFDALLRWTNLNSHKQRIESFRQLSNDLFNPASSEDDNFRIRTLSQISLGRALEQKQQTIKWGPFLRAPQVYFDLLRDFSDKFILLRDLSPPARGGLTRINSFFHLTPEKIKSWGIRKRYCLPLIKSPGETDTILINPAKLELRVFVCHRTKHQLREEGSLGTLEYIEWGEKQEYSKGVQRGMSWPDGPWVRNRKPGWYALPYNETKYAHLFISMAYGTRHLNRYSLDPLIADNRLYLLDPIEGIEPLLLAAVMNSSIVALMTEIAGRVTLGDGALELKVEDARDYLLVPDAHQFNSITISHITKALSPLLERSIGSVFDEIKRADRHRLDRVILKAMGLDPDQWLTRIYNGLTTLVNERIQLAQMRSETRRSRPKKATRRVADDVLQDIFSEGRPDTFPDRFLSPAAISDGLREIRLPSTPLKAAGHFMGKEELETDEGLKIQVANKFELKYVIYAQAAGQEVVRLPTQPVEVSRTVNNYIQYLRDLRQQLHDAFYTRTLDRVRTERFVNEVWGRFNLPAPED